MIVCVSLGFKGSGCCQVKGTSINSIKPRGQGAMIYKRLGVERSVHGVHEHFEYISNAAIVVSADL